MSAGARGAEAGSRRIRQPIIVIGSARSGTSLLSKFLGMHPDVAYLGEPRPIWTRGHAYRGDDALGREDLTPRVADYIDRRFAEFLGRAGRSRLVEKTPSNCFRIPFIHELYPDCRIIHIFRDGRDVVHSLLRVATKRPSGRAVVERLRQTPPWEWPGYLPMFFRTFWRTNVLGVPASHWGPRPPGWREWLDLPPHIARAHQWKASVEAALRDGRTLHPENYLELRYEEFVRDPEEGYDRIFRFAELTPTPIVAARARERIDVDRASRWQSTLSEKQEGEVLEVILPALRSLGYV